MDQPDETPGGRGRPGALQADGGPTTEQVRIAAVEAAVAAGLNGEEPAGAPAASRTHEHAAQPPEEPPVPQVELPDWADPPTGQVPRVLLDAAADEASTHGPTWRERPADWDDDLGLGPLDEAADETIAVAGREAAAGRAQANPLDGPIEFAGLDDDLRLARPGEHGSPPAGPAESDEGLAAEEAWAAFAAGAPPARTARAPRRRRSRKAQPGKRNPIVATATGIVAGGVAIAAFAGGAASALALVALVATLAAGEACGALRRSGRRPATLVGLAGVAALVVGAYLYGPLAVPVVVAACVVASAIWFLGQAVEPEGSPSPAGDLGATLLVVAWVGVLAAFAGLLLSPTRFPGRHGVAFLLAAVLLTVAHDVGSYAAGATIGRHKVAPTVSPNKTWEGLLGGTVLTFAVAVGVARIHPIDLSVAFGLAALVCVLGPLGDLTESLVKRDLGVKDMGRVLPAHGGFFDRIDAMLFVLPAAYFLFRVAHLS